MTQAFLGLMAVEAGIALMGLTLGLASRARDRRRFREQFVPYTHFDS